MLFYGKLRYILKLVSVAVWVVVLQVTYVYAWKICLNAITEFARGVDHLTVAPIWQHDFLPQVTKPSLAPPLDFLLQDYQLEQANIDIPLDHINQLKQTFIAATALKLNELLLDQPVKVDWLKERGSSNPVTPQTPESRTLMKVDSAPDVVAPSIQTMNNGD